MGISYIVSPQPLPIAKGCLLYNTLVRHHHEYVVLTLWICDTDCLERIRLLLVRLGLHPLNHVPWRAWPTLERLYLFHQCA